jgi:hypothetical protein
MQSGVSGFLLHGQALMERESNKKTGPNDEAIIEAFKKCASFYSASCM